MMNNDASKHPANIAHEYGPWYAYVFAVYESSTGSFARWCADHKFKPNHLTVLRFGFCPTFFAFHFLESFWPAIILMSVILWLDIQDGRLARELNRRLAGSGSSALGAFLDQIADKITMIGAFWCLFVIGYAPFYAASLLTGLEMILLTARPIRNIRRARRGLTPDEGRSNHFGKIKVWAEAVAWYGFMFGPESTFALVPYVALAAALGFGAMSFARHVSMTFNNVSVVPNRHLRLIK